MPGPIAPVLIAYPFSITLGHEGEVATCRVTDRGPFIWGHHVDVAWSVARDLGLLDDGVDSVRFIRVAPPY